jgi:hypothetical protein
MRGWFWLDDWTLGTDREWHLIDFWQKARYLDGNDAEAERSARVKRRLGTGNLSGLVRLFYWDGRRWSEGELDWRGGWQAPPTLNVPAEPGLHPLPEPTLPTPPTKSTYESGMTWLALLVVTLGVGIAGVSMYRSAR